MGLLDRLLRRTAAPAPALRSLDAGAQAKRRGLPVSVGVNSETSLALIAQRAIATASMLQFDAYRAQHEVGSVFWQNLHRLYAAAERLGCTETEVDDSLRQIGKSSSVSAGYALVLLLYAASPYQLVQRQLIALRRWIARWSSSAARLACSS